MLQPIKSEKLELYRPLIGDKAVYGLFLREDLTADVLAKMHAKQLTAAFRLKKSRRWALSEAFPQMGWRWEAVLDFKSYKSHYHGKNDLPGGNCCAICGTWFRFGHIISYPEYPQYLVGRECATLLSDLDPTWAEKKLASIMKNALKPKTIKTLLVELVKNILEETPEQPLEETPPQKNPEKPPKNPLNSTFYPRRECRSHKGNLTFFGDFLISEIRGTIFLKAGRYSYVVNVGSAPPSFSPIAFRTEKAAYAAATFRAQKIAEEQFLPHANAMDRLFNHPDSL